MAYIGRSERTSVLLELIEDAEKMIGTVELPKVTETQAHRLATAFLVILATAKRHPDWPEEEAPAAVAAPAATTTPSVAVAAPKAEPELVTTPQEF